MEIKRKYTKATLKTEGHFICGFKSLLVKEDEKELTEGTLTLISFFPFHFFYFYTKLAV